MMSHPGQAAHRPFEALRNAGFWSPGHREASSSDEQLEPSRINSRYIRYKREALHGLPAPGAQLSFWALRAWPELLAFVCCLLRHQPVDLALPLAVVLRLAWLVAELVHGTGHSLARCVVDRDPHACCWSNIREHRSTVDLIGLLLPFAPLLSLGVSRVVAGDPPRRNPQPPLAWLASGDLT
ncbi:MAG: hypothetical protein ACK56I_19755, partial [bacterium]